MLFKLQLPVDIVVFGGALERFEVRVVWHIRYHTAKDDFLG